MGNDFAHQLFSGTIENIASLDTLITKFAENWELDRMAAIDRNILRLAAYEIVEMPETPINVIIDEAVEIAKKYSTLDSGKFVNGVLGSVYKEIGEPGKDAVSKRKDDKFNLPFEKMPIEHKGGAVVYAKTPDGLRFAFVHDVFGHWTLSKGGIDGADESSATKKKIKEELGLDVEVGEELARNEYVATHPEKGKIRKQVVYFLAEAKHLPITLEKTGGLNDAKWFKPEEIADLNFYDDIFPIVTKAIKILTK